VSEAALSSSDNPANEAALRKGENGMGWTFKATSNTARDEIENILGETSVVRGDLKADRGFRVDGKLEGSIESAAAVIIGARGQVKGDVHGSDIIVAGRVHGNVVAMGHLDISATGRVEGDISAKSFRIETGGVFRGTSHMGAASEDEAAPSSGSSAPARLQAGET
jgi:cytoskeletal protein CcmA (bactofilin family)